MVLDRKNLEEWKRWAETGVVTDPECWLTLIAEVERLSATLAPESFAEAAEQLGGDSLEREQILAALQAAWRDGRAGVERLRALLREVEWAGDDATCPTCGAEDPRPLLEGGAWGASTDRPGHKPDCRLAAETISA